MCAAWSGAVEADPSCKLATSHPPSPGLNWSRFSLNYTFEKLGYTSASDAENTATRHATGGVRNGGCNDCPTQLL